MKNDRIELNEDGFVVLGRSVHALKWADIARVDAYKVDLLTTDMVRVEMEIGSLYYTVNEEMDGYSAWLEEVARRLPGFDMTLYWSVIQPPFATNLTRLWPLR